MGINEELNFDQQLRYIKIVQDNLREYKPDRDISIAITKLDEARLWIEEFRRNNS